MFVVLSFATASTVLVLTYCAPIYTTIASFQLEKVVVVVSIVKIVAVVTIITTGILVYNINNLLLYSLYWSGNVLRLILKSSLKIATLMRCFSIFYSSVASASRISLVKVLFAPKVLTVGWECFWSVFCALQKWFSWSFNSWYLPPCHPINPSACSCKAIMTKT